MIFGAERLSICGGGDVVGQGDDDVTELREF